MIMCRIDVITEALKATDLQQKWNVVREEVIQLNDKINQIPENHELPLEDLYEEFE